MHPEPLPVTADDTLTELELLVARRADELTRERRTSDSLNLHCWLVAEYEVLGREGLMALHNRRLPANAA